ncbi:hypothetical protein BDF19DRAFT_438382 [Syncephalis fuscata]|nr:hypothetical protein BDF19DRAFT_438382 [Syncephalis fuscata]
MSVCQSESSRTGYFVSRLSPHFFVVSYAITIFLLSLLCSALLLINTSKVSKAAPNEKAIWTNHPKESFIPKVTIKGGEVYSPASQYPEPDSASTATNRLNLKSLKLNNLNIDHSAVDFTGSSSVSHLNGIEALPPTQYKLHGIYGSRDATVKANSLCLNRDFGLFQYIPSSLIFSQATVPQVNIKSADRQSDYFFPTRHVYEETFMRQMQQDKEAGWPTSVIFLKNTTLFVGAMYSPEHYSHFFVHNVLPLIEAQARYFAPSSEIDRSSYTTTAQWMNEHRHAFLLNYGNTEAATHEALNAFKFKHIYRGNLESLPRGLTVCYDKVAIGLNSTCAVGGCVNEPAKEMQSFSALRHIIFNHYRPSTIRLNYNYPPDLSAVQMRPRDIPEVVVIQRRSNRRILNMEHVIATLQSLNINFTYIAEQIALFSRTRVVIAVHGNALGNLLWMPPNSLIIEVWQYGWKSDWFSQIVRAMYSEITLYHEVVGCVHPSCASAMELSNGTPAKQRSVVVDAHRLRVLLLSYGFGIESAR